MVGLKGAQIWDRNTGDTYRCDFFPVNLDDEFQYNSYINKWDVGEVEDFHFKFNDAVGFQQDFCSWVNAWQMCKG